MKFIKLNNFKFKNLYLNTTLKDYKYEYFFKKSKTFLIKTKHTVVKKKNISSFSREYNYSPLQKLLNVASPNGKKINILKHLNFFSENFFSDFDEFNNEYLKYENYQYFFELLNEEKIFHDFNKLLILLTNFYQFVFDFKTNKVNKNIKKSKKPFKKPISFFYIRKEKRFKHTLKLFYLYSSKVENVFFFKRIYSSFLSNFFNRKESDILQKRFFVYSNVIKQFSKKK